MSSIWYDIYLSVLHNTKRKIFIIHFKSPHYRTTSIYIDLNFCTIWFVVLLFLFRSPESRIWQKVMCHWRIVERCSRNREEKISSHSFWPVYTLRFLRPFSTFPFFGPRDHDYITVYRNRKRESTIIQFSPSHHTFNPIPVFRLP